LSLWQERTLKWEILTGLFFILLSIFVVDSWSLAAKSLAFTSIIVSFELANSAIEGLCDFVDSSHNVKIKKIKDMAAGAVTISSGGLFLILIIEFLWLLYLQF
jgi:diacylglycerol kinase (ATP)